jgi:hypothetical protein
MPSIFIWKEEHPATSKKYIRYYSGSNWFLEDHEYRSHSYLYLQQIVIPGQSGSVITFHAKKMPTDWVGSELLEVYQVPYRFIKSDQYGTLEQIGNWMRFIRHDDVPCIKDNLVKEYQIIQSWIQTKSTSSMPPTLPKKYTSSNHSRSHVSPQKEMNTSSFSIPEPNQVQQQFQEFLQKYQVPTMISMINPSISITNAMSYSKQTKRCMDRR